MSERPNLTEILQRAVDVHVRYYSSLGQLAIDSLGALFGTILTLRRNSEGSFVDSEPRTSARPAGQQQPGSTIVLEGEAGSHPMGVFLVENGLSREISTSVVTSTFKDPAGKQVKPEFQFEPKTIRLAPKEQMLVRMTAPMVKSLRANVAYRGEISIPDLPGARVPVVIRRCSRAQRLKRKSQRNVPKSSGKKREV